MTNLEKFEDEIRMITYGGDTFAIKKDGNGEPTRCGVCMCSECKFYNTLGCYEGRKEWLKEEYIEPNDNIKLPKDIKTGTPIWVRDEYTPYWVIRIFSEYCDDGVACFYDGAYNTQCYNTWKYAKPFVEGVNPNEC